MFEDELFVPANVSIENEIWSGLPVKDGVKVVLITLAAAVIAGILVLLFGLPLEWCMLGVILVGTVSIGLYNRLPEVNRSIIDQINIIIAYHASQKKYHYKYIREIEE